ncbi:hypothetical protein [Williamsia sp. 1138]|uniref:hypothetical protein n=1 Tax=Williamsia sp. 1138 TaxID=1903117 RepID=UPI00117FD4E0|nr:hypothetical protein [Williamsia sp. 1138]
MMRYQLRHIRTLPDCCSLAAVVNIIGRTGKATNPLVTDLTADTFGAAGATASGSVDHLPVIWIRAG